MPADIKPFATTSDGRPVRRIRLTKGELTITVLTFGAILQDVRLAGAPFSLTLGSDQIAAYEGPMGYFGAIVGPVANRIAGAAAEINGKPYSFDANEEASTTLHGGFLGTHAHIWEVADAAHDALTLTLHLPDGFGGFPGNRDITAHFALTAPATLTLTLTATTDAPTLMNLTNHSYWTLNGRSDTAGQTLRIAADTYLPVDDRRIPTGGQPSVEGTKFDLRAGRLLDQTEDYDHNWCLASAPRALSFAAELTAPNGLSLTIETTEPGLQLYDAARLNTAPYLGHAGQPYGKHAGLALEAQRWPDAPNQRNFPSVTLAPGQSHLQQTRYSFKRV